jgi:release factor glutamine methyltransferase
MSEYNKTNRLFAGSENLFFSALSQRIILFSPMMPIDHDHTIENVLRFGKALLQNTTHACLDAELLLCHVLQVPRSYLYAHGNETVSDTLFQEYDTLLQHLSKGMPMAYLLGLKEFWSLEFIVNEHTLIPRPETELLVELSLSVLPKNEHCVIADLGVGSGAVAIALAYERPHWQVFGTDISFEALEVAKQNIIKHAVGNVFLLQTDWCSGLPNGLFHAIVSNPPYIASGDTHLEQLRYEPARALVSGRDGLDDMRRIIREARACLKAGGWLCLEHGYNQAEEVSALLLSCGYTSIKNMPDLSGIMRVTIGQWPGVDEDINK